MDRFSKSDPILSLYDRIDDEPWSFVGQTEWIANNHEPVFTTTLLISHILGLGHEIKLVVEDVDEHTGLIVADTNMGEAIVSVDELVAQEGTPATFILSLASNSAINTRIAKQRSTVSITARRRDVPSPVEVPSPIEHVPSPVERDPPATATSIPKSDDPAELATIPDSVRDRTGGVVSSDSTVSSTE